MVAALTLKTSARSSAESFNLPCRSRAGGKNGIIASSRLAAEPVERLRAPGCVLVMPSRDGAKLVKDPSLLEPTARSITLGNR